MKKNLWIVLLGLYVSTFGFNAFAQFQCFANDKGGHFWESKGSTEARAKKVAMNFCKAYSPHSSTCVFNKCINK